MPAHTVKLPVHGSATLGRRDATDEVREEESRDLVFGLVSYLGAGATWVASRLTSVLTTAGFQPRTIKLSTLIEEREFTPARSRSNAERTHALQDLGDELRNENGNSFIAAMGVREIRRLRRAGGTSAQAFIIDQLKHPKEVELLRAIYGQSFYLISVVCNESTRRSRLQLKYKGLSTQDDLERLVKRDRLDSAAHGQRVHTTFHLGDLFVVNEGLPDSPEQESLSAELGRLLDAITGREVIRPRPAERGMHAAWVASLRSACMSRQVGAAIMDSDGELVAVGRNDPPAFNGGLYGNGDDDGTERDYRCYRWPGESETKPHCRNDITKRAIYQQILDALARRDFLTQACRPEDIESALADTRIRDLIEFSRAVHAEMDALLSLTRKNGSSPVGGTLYSTTYPCHSCARHIIAAGIHEVVYIEPYDKSMAVKLHSDALSDDPSHAGKVICRLFAGVAPRRFARLFEKRSNLKVDGYYQPPSHFAGHADPVLKKSFIELEKKVADEVERQFGERRT
jgi:deoxycytidylate deaminase